jgi:hypothetical protein
MATTTTNYGWDIPQSTDLVKDGATAIATLGQDIDTSLYTALGGKKPMAVHLSTVTFSGVASQSINDVFSATYDNYLIELENTNSNSVLLRLRFKTASDDTGANYAFQHLTANGATVSGARSLSQTYIELYRDASSAQTTGTFIVRNPNKAKATHISAQTVIYGDYTASAFFNLTSTQYTGFTIFPATNTTSGTISVYGFNK